MTELICLIIGIAWGLWLGLESAKHYKNITESQKSHIDYLNKKIDGEDHE